MKLYDVDMKRSQLYSARLTRVLFEPGLVTSVRGRLIKCLAPDQVNGIALRVPTQMPDPGTWPRKGLVMNPLMGNLIETLQSVRQQV